MKDGKRPFEECFLQRKHMLNKHTPYKGQSLVSSGNQQSPNWLLCREEAVAAAWGEAGERVTQAECGSSWYPGRNRCPWNYREWQGFETWLIHGFKESNQLLKLRHLYFMPDKTLGHSVYTVFWGFKLLERKGISARGSACENTELILVLQIEYPDVI